MANEANKQINDALRLGGRRPLTVSQWLAREENPLAVIMGLKPPPPGGVVADPKGSRNGGGRDDLSGPNALGR